MQILVIEDDKRISDFLIKGLEENNHLVTLCKNAELVLENYLNIQFDLIICDIRMPEMTGDKFLSYVKKNDLFKSIPVIMLSSEDSTAERIKLLEDGASNYIVKPFNPMEIKVRIKKII